MSVKTTLNSTFGIVNTNAESGIVVEKDSSNAGFAPFKVHTSGAYAAAATLTNGDAGVTTVAGGSATTLVMPLASTVMGSTFCFRSTSAQAHALTCSQETNGTKAFTDGTSNGSKLALPNIAGSAVTLFCDGVNFLVIGKSGSLTINGT